MIRAWYLCSRPTSGFWMRDSKTRYAAKFPVRSYTLLAAPISLNIDPNKIRLNYSSLRKRGIQMFFIGDLTRGDSGSFHGHYATNILRRCQVIMRAEMTTIEKLHWRFTKESPLRNAESYSQLSSRYREWKRKKEEELV